MLCLNFILSLQKEQIELEQVISKDGSIEKKVKISTLCKVEWYEKNGETNVIPVTGVAVLKKCRGQKAAEVTKVLSVSIGVKCSKKGYELKPGIQSCLRRTTVSGELISDVPTRYTIVGLENYELPVVG